MEGDRSHLLPRGSKSKVSSLHSRCERRSDCYVILTCHPFEDGVISLSWKRERECGTFRRLSVVVEDRLPKKAPPAPTPVNIRFGVNVEFSSRTGAPALADQISSLSQPSATPDNAGEDSYLSCVPSLRIRCRYVC
jgi:hypothetical protein